MATGKVSQAESAFKKAFAQYRTVQDLAGQTQILMDLGNWHGHSGDSPRAVKFFEQALSFAEKLPEGSPLMGQVCLEIGRFYERVTDYPRAEEKYSKSIEQFTKHRHYHLLAKAYQNISSLWVRQGEFQHAEYYARESLSIASFKEDWMTLGATYFVLSQIEESKGNPAGILERLGEAVFVLERQPQNPIFGEALVRRANFYEKNRQMDQAQKEAEKILALGNEMNNELLKAQGHMVRGKVARRDHKRLDEAFNEFRVAQGVFDKTEDAPSSWECAFELGEIERNRGNASMARALYESALNQLNHYANGLPKPAQELFLKDGKRDQIEEALKWLR